MSSSSDQHSSEHTEDDQSSEGSGPINNTAISDTSNKSFKSAENMVSLHFEFISNLMGDGF